VKFVLYPESEGYSNFTIYIIVINAFHTDFSSYTDIINRGQISRKLSKLTMLQLQLPTCWIISTGDKPLLRATHRTHSTRYRFHSWL